MQTLSAEFNNNEKNLFTLEPIKILNRIGQSSTDLFKNKTIGIRPNTVVNELSFTHLVELLKIDEDLKRSFYEIECIKGNWSVRELKDKLLVYILSVWDYQKIKKGSQNIHRININSISTC